jgi:hypothetical protein
MNLYNIPYSPINKEVNNQQRTIINNKFKIYGTRSILNKNNNLASKSNIATIIRLEVITNTRLK